MSSTTPPTPERDEEHTAVYHVTAELLDLAKRNVGPSEPPIVKLSGLSRHSIPVAKRVGKISDVEELSDDRQTVTFKVPPELLDQARRLFDAQEDTSDSTAARTEAASDAMLGEAAPASAGPPVPLQVSAASQPSRLVPNSYMEEESTTVWKPDFSQVAIKQSNLVTLKQPIATFQPAPSRRGLLWGAIICLALAVVVAVLRGMGLI
jgi:hypothetical protein